MDAPQIQYAKTKDGVNIAYYAVGEGAPLVRMPISPSGLVQADWAVPQFRRLTERIAEGRMLVRHDVRGIGLSDEAGEWTLEALCLDLDAVLDALDLPTCALWGLGLAGLTAIGYAALRPERVSHLVLWNAFTRSSDLLATPRMQALLAVRETDWDTYIESVAKLGWGLDDESAKRFQALRKQETQESVERHLALLRSMDVTHLLDQVRAQTQVVHVQDDPHYSVDLAKELTSKIPRSQLIVLESEPEPERMVQVVNDFLGVPADQEEAVGEPDVRLPSGMTAILFLDIADSTALTTKLGDEAYRDKERTLDASLRTAITDAGGTPLEGKLLGDGILSVYASARQAIDAAQRCRDIGNQAGLPLHLGIHAGDVIHEENDVRGGAVQLAARVQSMAATGEILVSDIVRGLARTSAGVAFEDRGEHELKGIDEPQRLFAVREQG